MGIIRQHGFGLVGADAERYRLEERLVIVAGERGGAVFLDERPFAAALAPGADLQHQRHIHAARPHAGGQRLDGTVIGNLDAAVDGVAF